MRYARPVPAVSLPFGRRFVGATLPHQKYEYNVREPRGKEEPYVNAWYQRRLGPGVELPKLPAFERGGARDIRHRRRCLSGGLFLLKLFSTDPHVQPGDP